MKSVEQNSKPGHITHGDIFDDLGFSPAETLEAKIKSDILHAIVQHSEQHGLSQAKLAQVLKVHQPDVSNLLRGKIGRFSITRLIQFASRLDLDARVEVKPSKNRDTSLHISAVKSHKKTTRSGLSPVKAA